MAKKYKVVEGFFGDRGFIVQVKRGLFHGWKTLGRVAHGIWEYDEVNPEFAVNGFEEAVDLIRDHEKINGAQ